MLAESSDTRERQIAGDAHERAHAHDFAVADAACVVETRMTWRAALVSPGGGSRSVLRGAGGAVGDRADGAAQRGFDALRHGGEIGLAVERRKNGAAHESRAAQTGQDGAAEPLHRDAAAVDQAAGLAVDGQRRLVAEIDLLGLQAQPICAAPLALIQDRRPLHSRPRRVAHATHAKVPNATGQSALDARPRRRRRSLHGPSTTASDLPGHGG